VRTNHLIEPIKCVLEASGDPLSEYALLTQLQKQGWLEPIDTGDAVALYSAHFLVYNALFQLHPYFFMQNQDLIISALYIAVIDDKSGGEVSSELIQSASSNQAEVTSLRDYYLDWNNLESASKDSVEQLLSSFWARLVSDDDLSKALFILDLPNDSAAMTIRSAKAAYRKLAMQHHPDRGGDTDQFQRIQWAFGVLQRAL
jgi:hypothetical protein